MQIDFSVRALRWAPSGAVESVSVAFGPNRAASLADLVVRENGTSSARCGTYEETEHSAGILELSIPFHSGALRSVIVVATGSASEHPDPRPSEVAVGQQVKERRRDRPDALIIVLHDVAPPDAEHASPPRTFERRVVAAGADVVLGTHAASRPRIDVIRGRIVADGLRTPATTSHGVADGGTGESDGGGVLDGRGLSVSVDLLPDRSTVHVQLTPAATVPQPETEYTEVLARSVDADAFLHAVAPAPRERGDGFTLALDAEHRADTHPARVGTGTTITQWEEAPEELEFDRGTPARMYMWKRELRRRGATVDTIGTRVLFGTSREGERYLVHVTGTNRTGVPGSAASGDKHATRRLLREAGVSIADGERFDRTAQVDDALPLLDRLAPVVVKPVDGHAGHGVTVGVRTPSELRTAWDVAAAATASGILIERQFIGEDVRVSVLDGVARAANQRVPPQVIGDGARTVRELINEKNDRRHEILHLHSKPITLDPHRLERLKSAGLTPLSILPDGATHVIDHKANLATGAEPVDVTESIHPSYLRIAERAAAAFPGLGIAGVDILCADPTRPADDGSYIVIEVNSLPDIASHGTAFRGTPRNVVSDAADVVLSRPQPLGSVRRRRRPAHVETPTSATLLAAELSARSFTIDWLTSTLFLAHGHGTTLGFQSAMTDSTSQAARMVLSRPLLCRTMLAAASLPVPEARTFGPSARAQAWRYAQSLDAATVQFGGERPIDLQGLDRTTFDAAWSRNSAIVRRHRASIARRRPGGRFHFLIVRGRVLGILRSVADGMDVAWRPHPSYGRLAADAARVFAGADITQVTLVIPRPQEPATPTGVVVEQVRVDPDLVTFAQAGGARRDIVRTIVDLHLGAARPAAEPAGTWADDAASRAPGTRVVARSPLRRVIRSVALRFRPRRRDGRDS